MRFFRIEIWTAQFRAIPAFLRSFLLIWGLLAAGGGTAWAQAYNWEPGVIRGGGFVTGIVPHPHGSGVP
jgi:hypothetical protein